MIINKLQNEKNAAEQKTLVTVARSNVRNIIAKLNCAVELKNYSDKIYRLSKQHPKANPIQREAELALQKAISIESQPEYIAKQVFVDGHQYLRANGKRSGYSRICQMFTRYGSWTAAHVKIVNERCDSDSFQLLKSSNKLALTSEWFIARHARSSVSKEKLAVIDNLLAAEDKAA